MQGWWSNPFRKVIELFGRRERGVAEREHSVAELVLQASALLKAGVSPQRVWPAIAKMERNSVALRSIVTRITDGQPVADALAAQQGEHWRVIAVAWHLATVTGASLAPVLERIAQALDDIDRVARRRDVLLSGPRATIRLVASLPIVALLLGAALGANPFAVFASGLGVVLAVLGVGLLAFGVWWARRMIRSLENSVWVAGLESDLVWVAVSGGCPPDNAVKRVVDCADRARAGWVRLAELSVGASVRAAMQQASAIGTPVASMLQSHASSQRANALTVLEQAAERLAIRVLLPVGLCVLPSFIVLGVVPVLISVMGVVRIAA